MFVQAKSLFVSVEFSVAVIRDVVLLLTGRRSAPLQHILTALSDMHAIFRAARKQLGKGRYQYSCILAPPVLLHFSTMSGFSLIIDNRMAKLLCHLLRYYSKKSHSFGIFT